MYDAQTGAPAAEGAVATIRDGEYVETLLPTESSPATLVSASVRFGTYTVRVEKAGYEAWERGGVRVRNGVCGPEGARLKADLQPSP